MILRIDINQYRHMSRAGLLQNSHKVILGTVLFMFLFGKYIGIELEILIFILSPMGFMLDLDANKYVINYSIPISIKWRLQLMYHFSVVNSLLAVLMVNIRYALCGESRSLVVSLFIIMADVIGSNLYYYLFCSHEFKKDVLNEDKWQLIYQCIVGALIGIGIAIHLKWRISNQLEILLVNTPVAAQACLLGIMLIFTIWWTKTSVTRFEAVVRNRKTHSDAIVIGEQDKTVSTY